jgi:hypothetical protein
MIDLYFELSSYIREWFFDNIENNLTTIIAVYYMSSRLEYKMEPKVRDTSTLCNPCEFKLS